MNDPELIEAAEDRLDDFIQKSHSSGLPYWLVLKVLVSRIPTLMMQSDAEYHQTHYNQ